MDLMATSAAGLNMRFELIDYYDSSKSNKVTDFFGTFVDGKLCYGYDKYQEGDEPIYFTVGEWAHVTFAIDFENATNDGFSQAQTAQDNTGKDREINNIDNTINTSINNELYPQRVVYIPSPKAEGKKRPQEKLQEPKKEFVF